MTPAMLAALALAATKGTLMDPNATPADPPPTPDLQTQLAHIIGGLAAVQGGIFAYMAEAERVRKYREEMERLRIIEIDDRLYEHFVSSCLNGLLASGEAPTGNDCTTTTLPAALLEEAARYATLMLAHVRERRSPELRMVMVRAGLSKLSYEEVEGLAKEHCSGIRHLLDAVAEEARNDGKLDSQVGTFQRILRERDMARAALAELEKKVSR